MPPETVLAVIVCLTLNKTLLPRDFEVLGWCSVGTVLPNGEKVPL